MSAMSLAKTRLRLETAPAGGMPGPDEAKPAEPACRLLAAGLPIRNQPGAGLSGV